MSRFVPGKTFNTTACIACQKHIDIKFRHGARKVQLEVLTIRHIVVDFHPRVRIVAAFQQFGARPWADGGCQSRRCGAHPDAGTGSPTSRHT